MGSLFSDNPPIIEKARETEGKPRVYYIYGKTGSGKSRWIYDNNPDLDTMYYCKVSRYWIRDNLKVPAKVCWYPNFDDSEVSLDKFMRFINGDEIHVKGCRRWKNIYEVVFIESVVSPYELYKNAPEYKRNQMIRRMTILHKFK